MSTKYIQTDSTAVEQAGWSLAGLFSAEAGRQQVMIHRTPFTIGRVPGNDCVIESKKVSKLHAELIVAGDLLFLKDAGSTNGTFLNGFRIQQITPVGVGDLIQFADMEFEVRRETFGAPDETYATDNVEGDWLISQMHKILNCGQFRMVYQPIFAAPDMRRFGVEALLRCDIPGLESPIKLFQSAVRLGLEEHLSATCRKRAVETIATARPPERIFLNTHPNEYLGGELLTSLDQLQQLAPHWKIVVEIHEAAVPDLETIAQFRSALHARKIELAYDDFGAGQSRLREISQVPPDYVKFDRCLVDKIADAGERQIALLRSLVELCHGSGIRTIAEGIDNVADADCCQALGFELFQGYYFGKPASDEALFGSR